MSKGRAALTSRLHKISGHLRHPPATANPEVLRLYENADYSRVPVVRIHDSRIPWLEVRAPISESARFAGDDLYAGTSAIALSCGIFGLRVNREARLAISDTVAW